MDDGYGWWYKSPRMDEIKQFWAQPENGSDSDCRKWQCEENNVQKKRRKRKQRKKVDETTMDDERPDYARWTKDKSMERE